MSAVTGWTRIGKQFTFHAAHQLLSLPEGHKCRREHGHTYTVEVVWTAHVLTGPGFVTDFANFGLFKQFIDDHLDHQNLNRVLEIEPTSESLARLLAEWLIEHLEPAVEGQLVSVSVSESPSSWATFEVARG
ncbi:6-pyruvoyl trahydropterin synthase family protein [Streptomyces sp. NPDC085929]|uniref:6-pyruvoyl trahydropterin synthase family protein n=1 Tax=Streptomyces sp. NPDC085929 TaxID=3365739 RepID=UPI0037D7FEF6